MKKICIKLGFKTHCIFKYIVNNLYFLFVKHTEQILETNVTLQKINIKSYQHLQKSTGNQLFQCGN